MWHTMLLGEVVKKLKTDLNTGLREEQAKDIRKNVGENKLVENKKESLLIKFIKQFNDFMIIILISAAIISAIMAYIEKTNDYLDSIIILVIVVLNAIMGVAQEAKAEKSLEALKKMSAPTAKVKRDGEIKQIPTTEVVPGDYIIIETGSYIPADSRLIKSYNLKIEESALTGETVPVIKDEKAILKENIPIGDITNMVWGATIAVSGHGEAIVTDTGMNTKVGKIASLIVSDEAPETPLQKKLGEVGKKLGLVALLICFLIFIIGIFKKIPATEMFMTSVGLAVAAIPEGLPAIVTILLSIGVTKMAKRNSIIRKLPAVETLGSSSVICSDKTGTLTQNKMKVVKIEGPYNNINTKDMHFLLKIASMCTDCNISYKNKKPYAEGEPTEVAIVNCALDEGQNKDEIYREEKRINDIPFDSERKLMTTLHRVGNKYRIITKGAPDILINKCTKIYSKDSCENMTTRNKLDILNKNENMAKEALRVIAVAYKDLDEIPNNVDSSIEKNLTFVGLIGMIDPPREGVREAVETCKKAGIKTVMITGDHIITAKAIAKDLGILKLGDIAITGEELDEIPQKELEKNIMNYSVFARVSPEHKVRIVKAFQNKREYCSHDRRPE